MNKKEIQKSSSTKQNSFVHAKTNRENLKVFRQEKDLENKAFKEFLEEEYQDNKDDLNINFFFMSNRYTTQGKRVRKADPLFNTPDKEIEKLYTDVPEKAQTSLKKKQVITEWNDLIKLAEMIYKKETFYYHSKFYNKNASSLVKVFEESEKAWNNFEKLSKDMVDSQVDNLTAQQEIGLINDMRDHLEYWKYYMDELVAEYEEKEDEMSGLYNSRFDNLYKSMYTAIDKLKKPDSELLNLTHQSKNTVDPKVKRTIEKIIDKKIETLKEKRLGEFKNQVTVEKDKLKRQEEKDKRNLVIDAENKLAHVTSKQKSDFDRLINRYKNIKSKQEKECTKENVRTRDFKKFQDVRNRYFVEQATKKLVFRDDNHEFFKLKHTQSIILPSDAEKKNKEPLEELDMNANRTVKKNIKKNFYSVHCSVENASDEEADQYDDDNYCIKENVQQSNRKIERGFESLGTKPSQKEPKSAFCLGLGAKPSQKESKTEQDKSSMANLLKGSAKKIIDEKENQQKENQTNENQPKDTKNGLGTQEFIKIQSYPMQNELRKRALADRFEQMLNNLK